MTIMKHRYLIETAREGYKKLGYNIQMNVGNNNYYQYYQKPRVEIYPPVERPTVQPVQHEQPELDLLQQVRRLANSIDARLTAIERLLN